MNTLIQRWVLTNSKLLAPMMMMAACSGDLLAPDAASSLEVWLETLCPWSPSDEDSARGGGESEPDPMVARELL